MKEDEEAMDVCLAIEQMKEEAAVKERIKTLADSVNNLMESTGWTKKQAMDNMKISENDRELVSKLL